MISKYNIILLAALGAAVTSVDASAAGEEAADSLNAESQIQLAYRTVDRNDVLGGVEVLDIESLMKENYINEINNSTISGYVSGFNGNSLWGMDADNDAGFLVLIDGVARDMNNVSSTEVKSITFMKGAQASVLYGSRAAKGVIYITTKRGHAGPLSINVRANTGWHVAKSLPEYLGSAEYMTLYNEARVNDGLAPAYSDEQIYHTANKTNPYRYPDVNMYSSEFMKKVYNRSDATVEISGGNERARFYTNINYYRLGSFLKYGEAKNSYTDRFSVRGNVDVNITDWVKAYVNANATFYGARSPHGNYWEAATTFRPNRIAPLIPVSMINPDAVDALGLVNNSNNLQDGYFLAGSKIDPTNIFADYLAKGYSKFTSRQFQFDAGVNLDLSMLTKGLTFATRFSVDYATSYNTSYTDTYATFIPVWSNFNGKEEITSIEIEGKDEHTGVQNVSGSASRQTLSWSGQFDYNRTFADVHNFHALALAAGWQRTIAGEYHRISSANIGFEVDYNYDRRYYADLSLVGLHSAKLAPGHRQGWSPSATFGWRISQEEFLKDNPVVNNLMLSVSVADVKSDMDIPGFYLYATQFTTGGWYSWGGSGGQAAAYPARGGNPGLGYVSRKEFTASVRSTLFNNLLDVNAQFFTYKMDGLVINNSSKFPTFFSTYYPASSLATYLNYNANTRTGFDFGVNLKKTVGEVDLKMGVTGTYYKTKASKRDETYEYDYQYRQGKNIDGIWGYRCLGFFATDEEAAAVDQSALGSSGLKAGDLKYADINDDGKIDQNDQVELARGGWYGAPFFMGVNLSASWKGFTLFVHGLGNFGGHALLNDNSYYKMVGDNKYSAMARDRWTPATAATATMPRLTTTNGANNYVASDFWLYSTDRFDIDKIQLTYDFPSSIIHGIVKGLQVYVSGDDLFTIGKNRRILEMNVGSAPQSRFYNIGAKVTF